jgi:hypothetical protein
MYIVQYNVHSIKDAKLLSFLYTGSGTGSVVGSSPIRPDPDPNPNSLIKKTRIRIRLSARKIPKILKNSFKSICFTKAMK